VGSDPQWRTRYAEKLIGADEAAGLICDGMTVHFGMVACDPWYLLPRIHERREELRDVRIYADLYRSPLPWDDIDADESRIDIRGGYLTALTRAPYKERRAQYQPATVFTGHRRYERDVGPPDVGYFHLSPPDEQGMMSFGIAMWDNKIAVKQCRTVVAEVREDVIRTAGDNFIHVDEIDYLVEVPADAMPPAAPRPPREEAELAMLDLIGALTAELVCDGDTVEIGVGAASNAVTRHLASKRDLGYHSELTSPGIVQLYLDGVMNGSRKSRDVGKLAVTMLPALPNELAAVQSPEHWDDWIVFGVDYIHNPSVIASQHQMTSINTATMLDLTGQIVFDSAGRDMITGPGGQLEFVIGAVYAPGGKSIHSIPSTIGERSRILAELPPGAVVGIPRYLADTVVTEFGVASLFGKTERERARELIAIAHPDHRGELTAEARRVGLL
jgi:4-hydroxybutyrate CoA-transferase